MNENTVQFFNMHEKVYFCTELASTYTSSNALSKTTVVTIKSYDVRVVYTYELTVRIFIGLLCVS